MLSEMLVQSARQALEFSDLSLSCSHGHLSVSFDVFLRIHKSIFCSYCLQNGKALTNVTSLSMWEEAIA